LSFFENIGSKVLKFRVLQALAKSIGMDASFEPELFPGLIFSTDNCKLTAFRSGKINITGAKCEADLNEALNNFSKYLN
jgi:TATA-box binding protein (TBP) (component of TFIID and TFIIIB)